MSNEFTISLFNQEISFDLFDPNTLAARGFAEAAATSAGQAAGLLANTTLAIGGYENTSPTITNGYFDVASSTAIFVANDFWQSYRIEGGTPGEWYAATMVVNASTMAAAAFVDDDDTIIGEVFGQGPSSGALYFERLLVQWPAGATALIGTASIVDTSGDGVFRRGGPLVEKVVIDQERAMEVAETLADRPWCLKAWTPSGGYFNSNGDLVTADIGDAWQWQVFPISGLGALRLENVTTLVDFTRALVWGAGWNGSAFATKLGTEGAGGSSEASLPPIVRIAPPGTTHVAVCTRGIRPVNVWISDVPEAGYARELSDLLDILNQCRGDTLLFDGDSLYQGGGVTGSVPVLVSAKVSATPINRAIGGSSPCNGLWYLREGADTIGLTGMPYASVRALGGCSLAELEERRANWNSFWHARIPDAPTTTNGSGEYIVSDEEYAFWQACSYENSIVPFMNSADRMLCNHTHNADPQSVIPTGWATFTGTLTGTNINDAVLTVTDLVGEIDFLMSLHTNNEFSDFAGTGLFIDAWPSGSSPAPGTYKVRGTWPGPIAATAMTARPFNFGWSERQLVVPGPGGTAGHTDQPYNDRGYYIGAMRFRLDLWRVAKGGENFRNTFIVDGYDQYDQKPNACEAQILFQRLTGVPLLPTWKYSSWSQNIIPSGPYAGKTVKQAWLPGESFALHDFADPTGRATRHRANITAKLLLTTPLGL